MTLWALTSDAHADVVATLPNNAEGFTVAVCCDTRLAAVERLERAQNVSKMRLTFRRDAATMPWMTVVAILMASFLTGAAPAPTRICLPALTTYRVSPEEGATVSLALEEALGRASGACVVSLRLINEALAGGTDPKSLSLCGLPMSDALACGRAVASTFGRKDDKLVVTIRVIDLQRATMLDRANLIAPTTQELVDKLPKTLVDLFAKLRVETAASSSPPP